MERFAKFNPDKIAEYISKRKKSCNDTLTNRLRRKFPDLPTECEAAACSERRVLEIAHKPAFRRNGGHRTLEKYERHMFWILCPTCHRVVDRGIETPEAMGLQQ